MNSSLLPRLKEMLEFDEKMHCKVCGDVAQTNEQDRLQPLLTRLCECVAELEDCVINFKIQEERNQIYTSLKCDVERALQALRDEVEKK